MEADGKFALGPEGWTKAEKLELIECIKTHGSNNIEYIHTKIRTKTKREIRDGLEHYKKRMASHPMLIKKKRNERNKVNNMPQTPLLNWAKHLTDSLSLSDLHTEMATAVRMIAEFEDIPPPGCTETIDFRAIYHELANALEGKPLSNDREINAILQKCIEETALSSKSFIRNNTLKELINSININNIDYDLFPRPTGNDEISNLRHLIAQRAYNPLGIPEKYLKPSKYDT